MRGPHHLARPTAIRGRARLNHLLAGILLLTAPIPAAAQSPATGFALNRFAPSGGGSDWFALESLDFRGHLRPLGGVTLDWADDPLAVNDNQGMVYARPIVDAQVFVHLGVALMLHERMRVGLTLPIAIHQEGNEQVVNNLFFRAPSRTVLGDARLAADAILLGTEAAQLAAGLELLFPSGVRSQYTGDGVVRVAPRLLAAGRWSWLAYALRLGFQTRGSIPAAQREAIRLGHELQAGVALGLRPIERLQLGAELFGASVVTADNFLRESVTPLELLFCARLALTPRHHVLLGLAPGFNRAIGSPVTRFLARFDYLPGP